MISGLQANEAEFRFHFGTELDQELDVVGFDGKEAISEPFELTLDLVGASGDDDVTADLLDQAADLEVNLPGGDSRHFYGVVPLRP